MTIIYSFVITLLFIINDFIEYVLNSPSFFSFSYAKQLAIVDQLFPPLTRNIVDEDDDIEYTAFNYWRDPFTDIEDSSSSDVSLQAIQSKPLPSIPEN